MADTEITQARVLSALGNVKEPALGQSLVAATLIRDIEIKKGKISLTVVLIAFDHPHKDQMEGEIRQALMGIDGVKKLNINYKVEIPTDNRTRGSGLDPIRNAIAIASGKGGVGKSTVAVNMAVVLAQSGAKVGLLDADVYGPNIPIMMGVNDTRMAAAPSGKMNPIVAHGVKLISMGFLVPREKALVWRGPMLHTAITQFINDSDWGELDYLLIDLPPGTGDAQLSMSQVLAVTGGVIVTLPQQVSLEDARRGLEMFREMKISLLGVVENMSYLELPDGQIMEIFGSGGGERLAEEAGVPYIGSIPMAAEVRAGGDAGVPVVLSHPDSSVSKALRAIAQDVALKTGAAALRQKTQSISINLIN